MVDASRSLLMLLALNASSKAVTATDVLSDFESLQPKRALSQQSMVAVLSAKQVEWVNRQCIIQHGLEA